MKTKSERIMETINKIKNSNNEEEPGLFGFAIREIEDTYSETGNGVLFMFNKYPEHAELLEEMLGAICGMNLDDIVNKMERERDYYNWL